MTFNLKGSHIVAILITVGVIAWMLQGQIIVGGQAQSENASPPPAERAKADVILQQVRYTKIMAQERQQTLPLRGRTQAAAIVQARSETSGIVQERLVQKGQLVNPGDRLCLLEPGVRKLAIEQAKTALQQAQIDLKANKELQQQGFVSSSKLLALQTAKDRAKTQLEQAILELEKTTIIAKTRGVIQDPVAEIGNLLNSGDICATIVQNDPMNFIGQISENKVDYVKIGNKAKVSLVSLAQVEGVIKYISPTADAQTRTFRIEIEIPNKDNTLRDGITAIANIELQSDTAFEIKSSWITLSDEGNIGVRTVGDNNIVKFVPVQILAQTTDILWVQGLTSGQRIITLGQEYVINGQKVLPIEITAQKSPSTLEDQS